MRNSHIEAQVALLIEDLAMGISYWSLLPLTSVSPKPSLPGAFPQPQKYKSPLPMVPVL